MVCFDTDEDEIGMSTFKRLQGLLGPQSFLATSDEVNRQRLADVLQDVIEILQEQEEELGDDKGYEKKLQVFFNDLLLKAETFNTLYVPRNVAKTSQEQVGAMSSPCALENADEMNQQVRKMFESVTNEIAGLALPGFLEAFMIWGELKRLNFKNPANVLSELEAIETTIIRSENWRLSYEKVALRALVVLWLQALGRRRRITFPTAKLFTNYLPVGTECELRLSLSGSSGVRYESSFSANPGIITFWNAPKIMDFGQTGSTDFKLKIRGDQVGKSSIQLHLLSSGDVCNLSLDPIRFYQQRYSKIPNPYMDWPQWRSFPFPTRDKSLNSTYEEICAKLEGLTGFLIVEIAGNEKSGKSLFIRELCTKLSQANDCQLIDSGEEGWDRKLQGLLSDNNNEKLPLVDCQLFEKTSHQRMDRFIKKPYLDEEVIKKRKKKALFIRKIHGIDTSWEGSCSARIFRVIEPLRESDVRALLHVVGFIGDSIDTQEFEQALNEPNSYTNQDSTQQRNVPGGSPIVHFDEGVDKLIWEFSGDFPGIAIKMCEKIVEWCNEERRLFVPSTIVQSIGDAVYKKESKGLLNVIWSIIRGDGESDTTSAKQYQRERVAAVIAKHANKSQSVAEHPSTLANHSVLIAAIRKDIDDFDPMEALTKLLDHGVILLQRPGEYRFRSYPYLMVVKNHDHK
jgi:hypothetical protein